MGLVSSVRPSTRKTAGPVVAGKGRGRWMGSMLAGAGGQYDEDESLDAPPASMIDTGFDNGNVLGGDHRGEVDGLRAAAVW